MTRKEQQEILTMKRKHLLMKLVWNYLAEKIGPKFRAMEWIENYPPFLLCDVMTEQELDGLQNYRQAVLKYFHVSVYVRWAWSDFDMTRHIYECHIRNKWENYPHEYKPVMHVTTK